MRKQWLYDLWAWMMLIAFSSMLFVKDTHYLYHHHCAHHHSYCEASYVSDVDSDCCDDDCAICHFQIAKVAKSSYSIYLCPAILVRKIETVPAHHILSVSFRSISPRAPPAV